MDQLAQLKGGDLAGAQRLTLAQGLVEFPLEILHLADSLEILDLSRNRLRSLPASFSQLQNLRILFLSHNQFEEIPTVLADCPNLSMIGFKSNQIRTVAENALPEQTRWLILTDNKIERLPHSMARLTQLQKLMLAGNQLRSLPTEMSACQNLELIRLAANQLEALPPWLLQLPRLAWLAYSGNPCCPSSEASSQVKGSQRLLRGIDWRSLQLGETLGEGASGLISEACWMSEDGPKSVAVKQFKGDMTSDGLPSDEMQLCIAAGQHPNLVPVLGQVTNAPKAGLVLSLISPDYENLGCPPSFETCTRDTFEPDKRLTGDVLLAIAQGVAAVAAHLHARGILHGDLYAHNILVNDLGHALLGDFGAASRYEPKQPQGRELEAIEVRAFGCLLEDLVELWKGGSEPNESSTVDLAPELEANSKRETVREILLKLREIRARCLHPVPQQRPSFAELNDSLKILCSQY